MSKISDLGRANLTQILSESVEGQSRVPGVVAGITDRDGVHFLEAAGERSLGSGVDMTTDSVLAIFSSTKAITGTTALQLVESGELDLDAPAKQYAPALGRALVLEGFGVDGTPRLRAPKRDITARHLLLHTAGFGYDFFNESYNRLSTNLGQPGVMTLNARLNRDADPFRPGGAVGVRVKHRLGRAGGRRYHPQATRRHHAGASIRTARDA